MTMDATEIGQTAAELMEMVAELHPDAEVGAVGVVVELRATHATIIEARTNDDRGWISAALFRRASRAFEQ